MSNTEYKARSRVKSRKILKAALDDRCAGCGATSDLQFDHVDPATKSFVITDGLDRPWVVLIEELMKCQLLCHDCHLTKSIGEADLGTVEHGGGVSGKKNCPCALCKQRKREYMRRYMRDRRQ